MSSIYRRLGLTVAAYLAALAAGHALAGWTGFAFAAGLVVGDLAWATRLGIPQGIWYAWRHRNDPAPAYVDLDDIDWDDQR
jgi:hypothetical protein